MQFRHDDRRVLETLLHEMIASIPALARAISSDAGAVWRQLAA